MYKALGNCYEKTGRMAMGITESKPNQYIMSGCEEYKEMIANYPLKEKDGQIQFYGNPKVIHAQVEHSSQDLVFGHAFIEDDKLVYDFANNRCLVVDKRIYYSQGNIKKEKPIYYSYTPQEAITKMVDTGHFGSWELETESGFAKGGKIKVVIDNAFVNLKHSKIKEWLKTLKKKNCSLDITPFQQFFINEFEMILKLLRDIDKNWSLDSNPNNFANTYNPESVMAENDNVICLYDIEDVQGDSGLFEWLTKNYGEIMPFESPQNNDNYKLIGVGEASQGAVYLDLRDNSILKLTASPYEVKGTSKIMYAQKEDEIGYYLIHFPEIYSIENVGKLNLTDAKYPSSQNYYAIRRADIFPLDKIKEEQVKCTLDIILNYNKIIHSADGYAGAIYMKGNIREPFTVLNELEERGIYV